MARERKATDEQIIAALLANGTLRAAAIIRHGINRGSAAADTFLLTGRIKRQRIRGRTPQGQAFFYLLTEAGGGNPANTETTNLRRQGRFTH